MLGSKNVWVGIFAEIIMSGSIPATRFSLWQNGALSDHGTNLTEQESDMKGNVVAV